MGWLDYVSPILGGISAIAGANNAKQSAGGAAAGATVNPVNVNSQFGSTAYTMGPDGRPTYTNTVGPAYADTMPLLNNLAQTGYGKAGTMAGMTPEQVAQANNPLAYQAFQGANSQLGDVTSQANTNSGLLNNLAAANNPSITDYLAGRGALGGGSNTLLNSSTDFLKNTDPSKLYDILSNIAKPGETSATQNMFNNLQSSGRLGLTQNGVLGDLGGLDLAQKTANNDRAAQAYGFGQTNAQMGGNLGIQMGQLGNQDVGVYQGLLNNSLQAKGIGADAANSAFANTGTLNNMGNTDLSTALGAGNAGLEGTLGINAASRVPLDQSIAASGAAAQAGANAGQFKMAGSAPMTNLLTGAGTGLLQTGLSKLAGLGGGGAALAPAAIDSLNASTIAGLGAPAATAAASAATPAALASAQTAAADYGAAAFAPTAASAAAPAAATAFDAGLTPFAAADLASAAPAAAAAFDAGLAPFAASDLVSAAAPAAAVPTSAAASGVAASLQALGAVAGPAMAAFIAFKLFQGMLHGDLKSQTFGATTLYGRTQEDIDKQAWAMGIYKDDTSANQTRVHG
jgi:hypothetical protein